MMLFTKTKVETSFPFYPIISSRQEYNSTVMKLLVLAGGSDGEHSGGSRRGSRGVYCSQRQLKHKLAGSLQPIWGLLPAGEWRCGGVFCWCVAVPSAHLVLCSVPQEQPLRFDMMGFFFFTLCIILAEAFSKFKLLYTLVCFGFGVVSLLCCGILG